jgi:hypothetical protein
MGIDFALSSIFILDVGTSDNDIFFLHFMMYVLSKSVLLFDVFCCNCFINFLGTPEVIVNQTVIYGNQSNAITLFCEVKGVPNVTLLTS